MAVLGAGSLSGAAPAAPGDAGARFAWAVSGGGTRSDDADGIGSDPRGNLVISGGFEGTSRLDARHTVSSAGSADIFAVGYGPRGRVRWAERFGEGGPDQAFDNDVDSRGDGVLTGSFNRRVDFGGPVLSSRGATLPRYGDAFLLKLGSRGQTKWVRQIGGPASDGGDEVVVGPRDGIYVIGDSAGDVAFTPTKVLRGGGGRDAWAARYRRDGSLVWARSFAGPGEEQSHGIGVDPKGDALVTGEFRGTARFGSQLLESDGAAPDVFLARLDERGRTRWARRFGDGDREIGRGVAADATGNVYFSGEYSGEIQLGGKVLRSAGSDDLFLARADRAGRVRWAVTMGGPGADFGPELEVDRKGNSYLAGSFRGTARVGKRVLRSSGAVGAFVARFSPRGRLAWVVQSGADAPFASLGELTVGPTFVGVLGRYAGTVRLGRRTLTSAGGTDFFLAGVPRSAAKR